MAFSTYPDGADDDDDITHLQIKESESFHAYSSLLLKCGLISFPI